MSKNFARLGLAASTAALTGAVCSMTAFASGTSSTSTSGGGFGTVGYLIFMVLLFAVMYFILIRPQKKKDKEAKAMQDSLQVGDEIVTIGGIVGLVVQVNEDNIVIETTSNRNTPLLWLAGASVLIVRCPGGLLVLPGVPSVQADAL
uniref:preprotein translocase subunit YajC n=1 Tax=Ruminococcus sp. TaxID=41978 RepID=UPI003AF47F4A